MFFHSIYRIRLAAALIFGALTLAADDGHHVEFNGRQIDLTPYLEGYPFHGFKPSYDSGQVFYFHRDSVTVLKAIPIEGSVSPYQGRKLTNIDFSRRNAERLRYRVNDECLYWLGDERNDEVYNIFKLDPETGKLTKLTDEPYIFGWNWNQTRNRVAYTARLGVIDSRLGELHILDLESGRDEIICRDRSEFRFTWDTPSWQPNDQGLVLPVYQNADRTTGNLVYINLNTLEWTIVCPPNVPRSDFSVHDEWLSLNEFLFTSNETGWTNIYSYDIQHSTRRQLTDFSKNVKSFELLEIDGEKILFSILSNPVESELLLIQPFTGAVLHQQIIDENIQILDYQSNRVLVRISSATALGGIAEITAAADQFEFRTILAPPSELTAQLIHTRRERLQYPTFDIDPATGKTRMLHAYLYHPKDVLPESQQIVMIQAFYGGGNYFSNRTQILGEAGIYVLSPAPRGSHGFGREFASLNDGDLGGSEIIDIIYAGQYISDRLGIPPERIGVYGGSHGGYSTMRLMTFPNEVNGISARFDWGFGISHAGFSDISHFHAHCNIPDWVLLEAGNPATEALKLIERSPLYHADRMSGRLLLTHGSNDMRVPVEGSRMMADSLKFHGKKVTYVEYEGQGHGIKGLENTIHLYQTWFDFLNQNDQ